MTADDPLGPLHALFSARSIAIVGASAHPSKRGHQAVKQLLSDGYEGRVVPVHPTQSEILGLPCFARVEEIPDPVDLALLCTPAATIPELLESCGRRGVKGAVILAAGFNEMGSSGERAAADILEIARMHGIRLIGPNTNGFFNLHSRINLVGLKTVQAGGIAVLSQSGNVMLALANEAKKHGNIGFSSYIGVGNQLDLGMDDYLDYLAQDAHTQAIILYVEGFKDGQGFLAACRRASQKKPVVIYKAGRTAPGQAAARSHTGALATGFTLTRDLLLQAGATVVERTQDLLTLAATLALQAPPRGNRVAVLADGGGHATITTDALSEHKLALAKLSAQTRGGLAKLLPPAAALGNPVDVAGGTDHDPARIVECARILLQDEEVDSLLLVGIYGGYAQRFSAHLHDIEVKASHRLCALYRQSQKALAVQTSYAEAGTEPVQILKNAGIPVFTWPEMAADYLAHLHRRRQHLRNAEHSAEPAPIPAQPAAQAVIQQAQQQGRAALFEHEALEILRIYEIAIPPYKVVRQAQELDSAASQLNHASLAMKIISPDILHKSEAGGVALNVSALGVHESFASLIAQAKRYDPQALIEGVLLAPMADPGLEVIIGTQQDPVFGPVAMFGLGGIFVEALEDISFRALPLSRPQVQEMIEQTKAQALLNGARGMPVADRVALESLILRLSALALAHPEISEIDLNPVRLGAQGYNILDARMILEPVANKRPVAKNSSENHS